MAICKDCECKVDKVNKKGICKPCQTRISNMKHRNKPYIPLKKLKNTNTNEYNKIMNMRKDIVKPTIVKTINTSKNKEAKELIKQQEIVRKDIEETFKSKKAVLPKDYTSILPIFEQLSVLFNNYIDKYKVAEEIFNKMEIDYKHATEKYSTMYRDCVLNKNNFDIDELKEKKEVWEDRYAILLEERRDIKNVIAEYEKAGYLFTDLSKDTVFMKKFNSCYKVINNLSNYLSGGNYKAEMSNLVAQEDFVVGMKQDTRKLGKSIWLVTVPTSYINNKSVKTEFSRKFMAIDEQDAIEQCKLYINNSNKENNTFGKVMFYWDKAYANNPDNKEYL